MKKRITDIAKVIRSKNAGPFELTLDIIFDSPEHYRIVKEKSFFTKQLVAELYGIPVEAVSAVIYFDPAHAVKIVLKRPIYSGSPGDTDVYGAQQHAPLLGISIEI
jgi:hypothetical protein